MIKKGAGFETPPLLKLIPFPRRRKTSGLD
jgi:hypothetical protein